MTYRGRVKNGQVALEEPVRLPEGAAVQVDVIVSPAELLEWRRTRRIQLDPEVAKQIATQPEYLPDEA